MRTKVILKRFLIIFVLFVVIMVGWNLAKLTLFLNADLWKYNADFDNYKDEFVLLKNYIVDISTEENEKFLVGFNKSEKSYYLYSFSQQNRLNCSPEIEEALETISKEGFSYKDSVLDVIEVKGRMVLFTIENGRYILAYSPKGRPKNFWGENSPQKTNIKKIENGWYHIVIKW